MKTKHTKGNWSGKKVTPVLTHFYSDIDNEMIFAVQHNEETMKETEANQKLISSAPDLLEALTSGGLAMLPFPIAEKSINVQYLFVC